MTEPIEVKFVIRLSVRYEGATARYTTSIGIGGNGLGVEDAATPDEALRRTKRQCLAWLSDQIRQNHETLGQVDSIRFEIDRTGAA